MPRGVGLRRPPPRRCVKLRPLFASVLWRGSKRGGNRSHLVRATSAGHLETSHLRPLLRWPLFFLFPFDHPSLPPSLPPERSLSRRRAPPLPSFAVNHGRSPRFPPTSAEPPTSPVASTRLPRPPLRSSSALLRLSDTLFEGQAVVFQTETNSITLTNVLAEETI